LNHTWPQTLLQMKSDGSNNRTATVSVWIFGYFFLQIVELENEMSLTDGTKRGRESTIIEPHPSNATSSGSRSSCCS